MPAKKERPQPVITPITIAVAPLKEFALTQAEEAARARVARFFEKLEAANGDVNAVAPYPHGFAYSLRGMLAAREYTWAHGLVETDRSKPYSGREGQPSYVVRSSKRVEKYVAEVVAQAAAHYDGYVEKLNLKVGQVVAATIERRGDVWANSDLCIVKADGTKETWFTQVILNHSKYGQPYNQWPTRKVK